MAKKKKAKKFVKRALSKSIGTIFSCIYAIFEHLFAEISYIFDVNTAEMRIEQLKESKQRHLELTQREVAKVIDKYQDCTDSWKIRKANKMIDKLKDSFNQSCKDADSEIERLENLFSEHNNAKLKTE